MFLSRLSAIPLRDSSLASCTSLRLRLSRRKAVSTHYFGHFYAVGKPASRSVDDLRGVAEILWTDCGGCNQAQCPRRADSIVIEAVNGTARNAKCLPRSELELFAVDRPG